ncbi:unnamed protein product, partial [Anisakis simplex]|uniref:CRAL-TRIO domain-containing protein n=1 Tax=Anisakis simplex TaxID=6269 RepID=A0A0M3K9J8_ANISI
MARQENDETNKQISKCVTFQRQSVFQAKDFLRPSYDTDYNLLRWAQGYNFNLDEALSYLIRHLKFREFYDLDNIDKLRDDKILKQYFPLGLVGKTGKDNHLLVVECAGRIDLYGILHSVQLNVFLSQRFKFQENMLKEINKMESIHKTQCSVIYILDLEGLKLDSTLLTTVTGMLPIQFFIFCMLGPYRILWTLVYTNYPEWVDRMIIVNSPTFISVLWKAISPLIPERTRNKVRIVSTQEDSINELKKCCDMKYVPKHWGGELIDNNGDPMCRDRLIIPTDTI